MPGYIKVLRWLVAVMAVLLPCTLALNCICIYRAAPADGVVFTRELVGNALRPYAIVFPVFAVAALAVGIAGSRYRKEKKLALSPANRLRLAKSRAGQLSAAAIKEERFRKYAVTAILLFAGICLIAAGMYFADGDNFVSWDTEQVMGNMLIATLPWLAAAFAALYAASVINDRSIERELALLKKAPAARKEEKTKAENRKTAAAVRIALLVSAIALIAVGAANGGARDVLVKAINICTECIGLG